MSSFQVLTAGPSMTLQDFGRLGHLASGLSRGGAADRFALVEGRALLGATSLPVIELAGFGGAFLYRGNDAVIALTGAPMKAVLDGKPLGWGASHSIVDGQVLEIGSAIQGTYGYLSVAGGLVERQVLGSASAHLNAGIGRKIEVGDFLQAEPAGAKSGMVLPVTDRFNGGELRILAGPQTHMFSKKTLEAFLASQFLRTARGNRMGVELDGGQPFVAQGGLSAVSEMIVPGDIQLTGSGAPYILGPECQTTGGYPRIATVIPSDLDRAMQAQPGTAFSFRFVDRSEAMAALKSDKTREATLEPKPLIRDPHDIPDLLSYQLIDGIFGGDPS